MLPELLSGNIHQLKEPSMTSAISSLSNSFYNNVVAANPHQSASKVDSDGGHDNSRSGEVGDATENGK
jgi:hypothetical protein